MSRAEPASTEESRSQYRINLTDIRGVGDRIVEYLNQTGISTISEVHLLRKRTTPTYQTLLSRGVSSDTLGHLKAVGKAVHYTGSNRVEAKHLTHPEATAARDSKSIDLTHSDTGPERPSDEQQSLDTVVEYDPDQQALSEAVTEIQSAYDTDMDGQTALMADTNRFISESETYDSDDKLPQQLVYSLLRYQHDADVLTQQRSYEAKHGSMITDFVADTKL